MCLAYVLLLHYLGKKVNCIRPIVEGVGTVGRPPALKGHFFADCSDANILNIVRLLIDLGYHVDSSFDHD